MADGGDVGIALVVAIARNGAIGVGGDLPWRLPGDLAHFKRVTLGKPILMGRKTWESLPRRPLSGRPNLVVTRAAGYAAPGAEVFADIDAAIARGRALARESGAGELAVIGGAEVYAACLPLAARIYLTEVEAEPEADAFFPAFDRAAWTEAERMPGPSGDDPAYMFVVLTRPKP